eukprot:947801-Prymnesium_polylepis.1
MQEPSRDKAARLAAMPTRGVHSIDAQKRFARSEGVHAVGIDPRKRELVVTGVGGDRDDPKGTPAVRYTADQRRRDIRTRQYWTKLGGRSRPPSRTPRRRCRCGTRRRPRWRSLRRSRRGGGRRELARETPEWLPAPPYAAHGRGRARPRIPQSLRG